MATNVKLVNVRKLIGQLAAVITTLLCLYMLLGMAHLVPLMGIRVFGESLLRALASIAVLGCLISAWSFWEL